MHSTQNCITVLRAIFDPNSLQEVNLRGSKIKHDIELCLVVVDNDKDLLLGQLVITEPGTGSGYVYTSTDLKREWYEQLTAEQRILTKFNGKDANKWVKLCPRNEVLDFRNYALHAAMANGIHKWLESKWLQLEQGVQPSTPAAHIWHAVAQPATSTEDEDVFDPINWR